MPAEPHFVGIELGGTKSIAVRARDNEIIHQIAIPTTSPQETLTRLHGQIAAWQAEAPFAALGIASFGPLELAPSSPKYGDMLTTPKHGWENAAIAGPLTAGLECPWAIDTDVNAAALAEFLWGAASGCDSACYVTIGTGVGGGLVIDGKPVHGAMHPEIGHLKLRRAQGDVFRGACPFHGDCIEGLISGPALAQRFGGDPAAVPDDDPRWHTVASDLAELVCAILLTTSARRILIGGGVGMARASLLSLVRRMAIERLGGYLPFFDDLTAQEIVRAPALGHDAGPWGAIALARMAATAPGIR